MALLSEKEKSLTALTSVLETSKAALAFLGDPVHDDYNPSSLDSQNLSVLHKDFLSLLSLIHGSVTKIALVLKPSSPSYSAALEPLKELKDRVAALPHCARLLQRDHGKTLATEATNITKDVLEGIKSLMQTFITIDSEGSSSSGEAGDEYMVRTGTVHSVIDNARGQDGFSGNNLAAVRKIWKSNQESLNDGVSEIREILEDTENPEANTEEDIDDGWGELGMSSNVKPSVAELERIKKIYAIVRLSALLHQRLLRDVLSPLSVSTSPSKNTNSILDDIAQASSDLLIVSDDLISTVYPPQAQEDIKIELENYQRRFSTFQAKMNPLIPETYIEDQFKKLRLVSSTNKSSDYAKLRNWYTACINQISKNIHELEQELKESEIPLV